MAEKYDINILLDLHGLKGSQNAEMHSGKIGQVHWKKYLANHLEVLVELAQKYKESPSFWALEIINEPKVTGNYFALLRYYREAYKLLRGILRPGIYVIFHDGFVPPLFSGALRKRKDFPVIMDTHFYGVFPGLLRNARPKQYDTVRRAVFSPIVWLMQLVQPLIVGEWSSVLPQSFFDRVPESQHLRLIGETIARQRTMYKRSLATFYWSYKTEGRGMFNYRSLVEDGIIDR
jgi:glucan 1,3-beta-glucosidase